MIVEQFLGGLIWLVLALTALILVRDPWEKYLEAYTTTAVREENQGLVKLPVMTICPGYR